MPFFPLLQFYVEERPLSNYARDLHWTCGAEDDNYRGR